jgi:hypothetical protein
MRIINRVGIGMAVLSTMVAVAAYGQKDAASNNASKADTVVDAKWEFAGTRCPIARLISSWGAGRWQMTTAKDRRSFTTCMHPPTLSPHIAGMEDSLMVGARERSVRGGHWRNDDRYRQPCANVEGLVRYDEGRQ